MGALKNAMIIGALPFTIIMVLMCLALGKALVRDHMRDAIDESTQAAAVETSQA